MNTSLLITCLFPLAMLADGAPSSEKMVVGGVEATRGEFPYIVQIRLLGIHHCSGVILNSNWVLTTAWCEDALGIAQAYSIIAGEHNLDSIEGSEQVRSVFYIERYEDIALMRMVRETPLEFNQYVQQVALPDANSSSPENATIAGWGRTSYGGLLSSVLMKAQVQQVDQQACNQTWGGGIRDAEVCYWGVGNSVCDGDEGGPLVANGTLIGLATWQPDCTVEYPGVYQGVSKYFDWIHDRIVPNVEDATPVTQVTSCTGNIDATSARISLSNIPPNFKCIWTLKNPYDEFRIRLNQSTLADDDRIYLTRVQGANEFLHERIPDVGQEYSPYGRGGVYLITLSISNSTSNASRSFTLDFFTSGYSDTTNSLTGLVTNTEDISGEVSYPVNATQYRDNEAAVVTLSASSGVNRNLTFTRMDVEMDWLNICYDFVRLHSFVGDSYTTVFVGCGQDGEIIDSNGNDAPNSFNFPEGIGYITFTSNNWNSYGGFAVQFTSE